ncbi:unnamed protein product, partial [Meganyctiphanes norvegica]
QGLSMLRSHAIFEKVVEFIQLEQNLRIVFNSLEGSYALCLLANLIHLADEEKDEAFPKLAFPKFNLVVSRLLEKCGEYVTTKQSSLTQWHPVLGWFSRPLDQHLNEAMPLVKGQLQLLWSGPIIRVMFTALRNLVKDQEAINESYGSPGGILSTGASGSLLKKALERKLSQGAAGGSLRSLNRGPQRKLGSPEVFTVAQVCSMYHTATSTLSQLRMDILTGLCYKSSLVWELWVVLLSLGNMCGLKSFLDLLAISTKATAPEFHLLVLFCDATTHFV